MSFYCLMCKSFVRLAAELSFSLFVCVCVGVYVYVSLCIGALTFTTLSSCCIFYNMFHRTHQFYAYPKATTKSALPHFVGHFKLSEIN